MQLYKRYCRETVDPAGRLQSMELVYPPDFNFGYDVVDVLARETPTDRALVWRGSEDRERTVSFEEMSRLSNQAAHVFLSAGIGRGDRVMVALKRHLSYWFVAVALHKIGAVLIPVTHMLTREDFAYRMACAQVSAVVCTPQNGVPQRVQEAVEDTGLPCRLFTVEQEWPGFQNLTQAMEGQPSVLARQETRAKDPMLLYFTSGTTGQPKGVVHDFTYPLAHIVTAVFWQQVREGGLHFTVAETGWGKASWGKIYGQWLAGCGVMVYDFDTFDPKQLAGIINRYQVTSFCAPPTVYRYLVKKGVPPMPSLEHASTAGEKLHPEVFRAFRESTGLAVREGYGQTETALLLANFRGIPPEEGAMGVPSPLYQVELHRPDGSLAEVGEIGEVVVRPRKGERPVGVFMEYLGDQQRYQEVWRGGVYHTGDAAWKDEKGTYWFHGRFDDIIKTGGFRVGPFEVEQVLMEHPAVLECSVIGEPDPLRGQAIQAVIVLSPGYAPTREMEQEIRSFANGKMAEYKWIRTIRFVSDLPKTISGKVRKGALRG